MSKRGSGSSYLGGGRGDALRWAGLLKRCVVIKSKPRSQELQLRVAGCFRCVCGDMLVKTCLIDQ